MLTIHARNVHQALPQGLHLLSESGVERETRNGKAIVLRVPLGTTYMRPLERVLFWTERDANPFFHFFESLWMLQGRKDVGFVARFAANMRGFSDDGETLHGAYGYRWLYHFGRDQIAVIIDRLKANPEDRRCVLQMWDAHSDLGHDGKDFPCNTHVYFQINDVGRLDMMVCNRSNDIVWGAYGSNAVHFSFLQEYIAACVGVLVGSYVQVSMNTHIYARHWPLMTALKWIDPASSDYYVHAQLKPFPLMDTPKQVWDLDLSELLNEGAGCRALSDPFLETVARPLLAAWGHFKLGGPQRVPEALEAVARVAAEDWRTAAREWLERRAEVPA